MNLRVKPKQKNKTKINRNHHQNVAEDLHDCQGERNRLRSADIAYQTSKQGGFYMVVIIDLHSHGILDRYTVSYMTNKMLNLY
jgi:hypothetical protein